MRGFSTLLAALLLLLPGLARADEAADMARAWELAHGEERILSFVSDAAIARNGDLDVTETIRFVSLAQEIKHGLQRDFPTSYRSTLGQKTSVGFTVLSVERDGHGEPYELIGISNGVRIRMGDAETMLPPGEHVYVIHYKTSRQIHYGTDSDELYWNATGTGWTFPIDMAEARIRLPSPAAFGERAMYTGPDGSTAHDAAVIDEQPGLIVFRTTRPLPSYNGLTVAAAFPKGVIDAPDAGRRLGWWLADWGALGAALLSLLGLAAYYIRAWAKAGRGPRAGPIVPIFSPPDDLSAAACRYISRMGMDNHAFSAAIVDLGVRGHIHITKEADGWLSRGTTTLERVEGGKPLPEPEKAMLAALFAGERSIVLKQDNHMILQGARATLERNLESAYSGKLFVDNRDWAIYGAVGIAAAILATAWIAILVRSPAAHPTEMAMPPLGIAFLATAWWLHGVTKHTRGGMNILAWLGLALAVGFGGMCAMGALMSALADGKWAVLLPLLAIPVAISAFSWMFAPTPNGRAVMDRIAGFRHYLGITEEDRLEALHPPEKTPELFERYLPYAIALDVENHWADRFAAVLAAAAAATGTAAHTASFYSGSGNMWDDPGGFANSLGSSLNSTISSAATSPSSSSGSGGGGSSGGGGGGGGGSGW